MDRQLHLRTLGHFSVAAEPTFAAPLRFSTRKVAALLAYLALARNQTAGREQLATLLWGECDDRQARHNLRQALVYLRRELGEAVVLESDGDLVRLKPGRILVDALEMERLATSSDLDDLAHASAHYQGELMSGFRIESAPFEEWLDGERRRFETIGTGLLERYASAADTAGQAETALAAAERLLAHDPLREDWQRLLLGMLARHRGRGAALARATTLFELLERELGAEPEAQTKRLVEALKADVEDTADHAQNVSSVAAPPASRELNPRGHLAQPVAPQPASTEDLPSPLGARTSGHRRTVSPPRFRVAAALAMMAVVTLALSFWNVARRPTAPPAPLAAASPIATPADAQPMASRVADWTPPRRDFDPLADSRRAITPIVVLPFTGGSAGGQADALGDSISDDITTILSTAAQLRVISRQTARGFKGQSIDTSALGRKLDVAFLVEGSVSISESRIRVNVGLVNTRSGVRVWSRRIERENDQSHAITDEIVNSICRQLEIELSRQDAQRSTSRSQVHDLIARGRLLLFEAGHNGVATLQMAAQAFEAALAQEPDNLQALVGLGGYHANMGLQLRTADGKQHQAEAEALLLRARQLGAKSATVHSYMGLVHMSRGEFKQAKVAFEQSITVNPSHAPGYAHLGRTLVGLGEPLRGLENILYAIRLSPQDPHLPYWQGMAGAAELELGLIDQAAQRLEQAHALNATVPRTLMSLIAANALQGKLSKAKSYLITLRQIAPDLAIDQFLKNLRANMNLKRGMLIALEAAEPL